jgi:hypothetical protein
MSEDRGDAGASDGRVAGDSLPQDRPGDATPLRVLFVGNSYTYVNDLPSVVAALAAATPDAALTVDSVVQGSARLEDHWNTTGARERIASGDFDVVVLQGQSLEPVLFTNFPYYAGLFADLVDDVGARAVWFATWARRAGDPIYSEGLGFQTPDEMSGWLEGAYRNVAYPHGAFVARVGAAWQLALAELPGINLYADDGSHPSAEGTLLAACVILQGLTGQAPRVPDPPPLGIRPATAQALCDLAPRVACFTAETLCNLACVDTSNDPANCGSCGLACPEPLPCNGGVCGCPEGLTACPPRLCTEVAVDAANCGACAQICSPGSTCQDGHCICSAVDLEQVAYPALSALRPGCAAPDSPSYDCQLAAHEYCAANRCFTSGFPYHRNRDSLGVVCVPGEVRATTYAELQALVPECDGVGERSGPGCTTAISRYCAATGAVSGFGPVADSGADLSVTCVTGATVVRTTFAALSGFDGNCDGSNQRWGFACDDAIGILCISMGYAAGFGPVEAAGDDVEIVCMER